MSQIELEMGGNFRFFSIFQHNHILFRTIFLYPRNINFSVIYDSVSEGIQGNLETAVKGLAPLGVRL